MEITQLWLAEEELLEVLVEAVVVCTLEQAGSSEQGGAVMLLRAKAVTGLYPGLCLTRYPSSRHWQG